MKDQREKAPTEIPEGVEGSQTLMEGLQKRNEAHGSKLERKLARRLARQEAA